MYVLKEFWEEVFCNFHNSDLNKLNKLTQCMYMYGMHNAAYYIIVNLHFNYDTVPTQCECIIFLRTEKKKATKMPLFFRCFGAF